jgi:hypothetical protein
MLECLKELRFGALRGATAAVETDRLQIVIYVEDGSLNEPSMGWGAACNGSEDQFFNGEGVAGL